VILQYFETQDGLRLRPFSRVAPALLPVIFVSFASAETKSFCSGVVLSFAEKGVMVCSG
jgi:hypothetical protein